MIIHGGDIHARAMADFAHGGIAEPDAGKHFTRRLQNLGAGGHLTGVNGGIGHFQIHVSIK